MPHDVNEKVVMIWLSLLGSPNYRIYRALLSEFGSGAGIYDAFARGVKPYSLREFPKAAGRFADRELAETAFGFYRKAQESGMNILTYSDPDYPELLKHLPAACPLVLYYYGDKAALPGEEDIAVAIVGSRHCSNSGEANARQYAFELAKQGVIVVSGLALGCDGAAHRGALNASGRTVAVLASGADVVYPKEHKKLYNDIIAKGGCVLSESPPGCIPARQLFPARNRIIAGLCQATLVVEAAHRSGALITADKALEADRIVFALPGDVRNPMAYGCNELIRQGAVCVTDIGVIYDELGIEPEGGKTHGGNNNGWLIGLPFPLSRVADAVLKGADNAEAVAERTELDAGTVAGSLTMLEIRGIVRRSDYGAYSIANDR